MTTIADETGRNVRVENAGSKAGCNREGLVAAGGRLGAIASSSCFILPQVWFSLVAVLGVTDVSVSYQNKTAIVSFDETQTSVAALYDATFERG